MLENVYRSQQVQEVGLRSMHMYACTCEHMCVHMHECVCTCMRIHTCEFVRACTHTARSSGIR